MAASKTEFEWHNLKAHELNALAKRDAVVIVPVGSTEQHGPHLPVQVDALLASEVTRRAAAKLAAQGTPVVTLPAVWTGLAEHHMAFGGTITCAVSHAPAPINSSIAVKCGTSPQRRAKERARSRSGSTTAATSAPARAARASACVAAM